MFWWMCKKKFKVYFMIIYCYNMNSLSCLSRFSRDPPNVVLILIQYFFFLFVCFTSTIFFLRVIWAGSESFCIFVCLCPLVENASNPTSSFFFYFLISSSWLRFSLAKQTVTIPLTFEWPFRRLRCHLARSIGAPADPLPLARWINTVIAPHHVN